METNERENTSKSPRISNAGKSVECIKMKFGGKKYDIQFSSTGKKKRYFIHDMHKLAMDVIFTKVIDKKGINKNGERLIAAMYKE